MSRLNLIAGLLLTACATMPAYQPHTVTVEQRGHVLHIRVEGTHDGYLDTTDVTLDGEIATVCTVRAFTPQGDPDCALARVRRVGGVVAGLSGGGGGDALGASPVRGVRADHSSRTREQASRLRGAVCVDAVPWPGRRRAVRAASVGALGAGLCSRLPLALDSLSEPGGV